MRAASGPDEQSLIWESGALIRESSAPARESGKPDSLFKNGRGAACKLICQAGRPG